MFLQLNDIVDFQWGCKGANGGGTKRVDFNLQLKNMHYWRGYAVSPSHWREHTTPSIPCAMALIS